MNRQIKSKTVTISTPLVIVQSHPPDSPTEKNHLATQKTELIFGFDSVGSIRTEITGGFKHDRIKLVPAGTWLLFPPAKSPNLTHRCIFTHQFQSDIGQGSVPKTSKVIFLTIHKWLDLISPVVILLGFFCSLLLNYEHHFFLLLVEF